MGSSGHTAQDSSGQLKTAHKLFSKHKSACRTAGLLSQQVLLPDSREQSSCTAKISQARAAQAHLHHVWLSSQAWCPAVHSG